MYLIRPYNDLHNEFDVYNIPVLPNESQTVLSLAGDIYDRKHLMEWIRPLAVRFRAVVFVLGNHDYWKGDVDRLPIAITHWLRDNNITNVHLLRDSRVEIGNTIFIGGTGWTDFNKKDPLTMISYKPFNDFRKIRCHNYARRWDPTEAYRRHQDFKSGIRSIMSKAETFDKRVVVLSHHAPHQMSLDPRYAQDRVDNGYYASDLSDLILDYPNIVLWHHGHVHCKKDYMIGQCRIICNPRGYLPNDPVRGFDPHQIIDLDAPDQTACE